MTRSARSVPVRYRVGELLVQSRATAVRAVKRRSPRRTVITAADGPQSTEQKYRCSVCGKRFLLSESVRQHFSAKHQRNFDAPKKRSVSKRQCFVCSASIEQDKYRAHMRRHESAIRKAIAKRKKTEKQIRYDREYEEWKTKVFIPSARSSSNTKRIDTGARHGDPKPFVRKMTPIGRCSQCGDWAISGDDICYFCKSE